MTKSSVSGSHSGTSKYNLWPLILQASASDFLVSFTTFTVMIRCSCLCSLAVSLGCLAQNIYKLSLSFLRTQNSSTNSFQDTKFVLEHDKKNVEVCQQQATAQSWIRPAPTFSPIVFVYRKQ